MSYSDIGLTEETLTTGSPDWCADFPAKTTPITLDPTTVLAAFPTGIIPTGTPLGELTAGEGMYGPYDDEAADGRQVAKGFLYTDRRVRADHNADAALVYTGRVFEDRLPADALDAAGKTDLAAKFTFVKIGA